MKRRISFIFAFALLCMSSVVAQVASGTCGDNLTWVLTEEGELIVEGTGEITSIPWRDFKGTITKVTLSAGVTGTVSYAFEGCSSLTTVNIPENSQLINIETAMFQNCSSLASITIPMSVTSIGYYAFDGCSSLASITIPESVAEIANYAFSNCEGLTSITIKSTTPPTIGYYSFVGVDMFVYVPTGSVAAYKEAEHWSEFANIQAIVSLVSSGTCGDNLTWELTDDGKLTIEGTGEMYDYHEDNSGKINHPWLECRSQIKTITIGEGVTSIGNTAFRDCTELTSISLNNGLKHIGVEAFRYCGQLTAIDFPESLTSIANSSFFECRGLLSVTIPEGITSIDFSTFYDCSSLKSLILPSGMTSIKHDAFKACHNLTEIVCKATTPPSISSSTFSSVSREAFVYVPQASSSAYESAEYWSEFTNFRPIGTCGDNLTWRITPEDELIVEGTGEMTSAPWFDIEEYRYAIKKATIMEGVTSIADAAFHYCTALVSISIPESVTSLGNHTFRNCVSLTDVTIPEGVTSIGKEVFQNCNSLTEVNIPEGVTSIGYFAFQSCKLSTITIPENVSSIGHEAFDGCSSLASITCRATTPPELEYYVYNNVNKSIPVYVPTSAIAAYKEAEGWKEFTNIQAPIIDSGTCGESLTWKINGTYELTIEGMGEMYDYSESSVAPWQNYKNYITSVDIKEGVTSIGSWAFSRCSALTDVSIAESVTSIGGDAFRECSILEEITLPKGLTELGTGVFLFCDALKSITVPEGVTKIGSDTFEFCPQLSAITFPSGLTEIGPWALKGAYSLTSITCKAATPPSLGNEVFSGVSYDITVYVPTSSVEAYKTAYGWNQFANIQPIILASGTCGDDLTWKLTDEGELTIEGTGAMTSAPWRDYTESIKVITIKEGVTTICDRAFEGCYNVVTVTIPKGVTEAGMDAFWDCTGVLYLSSIPVSRDHFMEGGFSFSRFTKVVISDDITEIGDMAFSGMRSLTEVVLPDNLQRIGYMAFSRCHNMTTITIPEGITTIGDHAFDMCAGLTSIVCKTATPPACGFDVFAGVDRSIPLFVSLEAINEYQSAEQWKEFTYFVGTANCGEDLTCELWPDGKLIVMGEGEITTAPWEAYREQIKELVLEEGVTGIADGAFADLENLASITSYAEIPPICGTDVFAGIDKTTPVYVPVDAVEVYSMADGWSEFEYLGTTASRFLLDTYSEYVQAEDEELDEITYVRHFSSNWEALYVPFDIPYETISDDFEVAYIYDTHQYDNDNDGIKDETIIELFKMKEGTLEANYPYLIRAKEAGKKEIVVNDATLYATEEVSIDCSSIFDTYTFTATYSSKSAGEFVEEGYYTLVDGDWIPATKDTKLGAFRFYLKVESRNNSTSYQAKSIRMRVIGENDENDDTTDTTDIENPKNQEEKSRIIFDLQGRRVKKTDKGVYIVNGHKVMVR